MKSILLSFAISGVLLGSSVKEDNTTLDIVFLQQGEEITEIMSAPTKKPFIIENPNDPDSMFILSSTMIEEDKLEAEITLRNNVSNEAESISIELQKEFQNCIEIESTFGHKTEPTGNSSQTELCIEVET